MDQITTTPEVYRPEFNPDTGEYFDKCPYEPNQRNRQPFKCPCNGIIFNKRQQFMSHIQTQTHKKFIAEYDINTKEVEDLKTERNLLFAENSILKRKIDTITINLGKYKKAIQHFKSEIANLKTEVNNLNNVITTLKEINMNKNTTCQNLQKELNAKQEEIARLEVIVSEITDYDSDDFKDCE